MEAAELDSEGDVIPANSQTQAVRKNISLKLKGKGKGGRGRGRPKKNPAPITTPSLPQEGKPEEMILELHEKEPTKFNMEEDIFKLEAPTFTTIDRGPPEPVHHDVKLRWDYKVNLIGAKVMNPVIHCCKKCCLPILLYGRMIPCKHIFCYDCARKAEKVCPRCDEKVSRVEQTGLGSLYMCVFGGTKRNGSDGCCRTYLSQRDLQAHINHRHLRVPTTVTPTTTTSTVTSAAPKNIVSDCPRTTASATPHPHPVPIADYRQRQHVRGPQLSAETTTTYRPPALAPLMSQLNPYSTDVHHVYDRSNPLVAGVSALAHQAVLSQYSMAVASQAATPVVAPPPTCVPVATAAGTVAYGTSPIPVVSVAVANVAVAPPARTNLITVPIHDDTATTAGAGAAPTEYLHNPYQAPPPRAPVGLPPQQAYLPPMVAPPYTTPPPVSYPTTYCTPTIVTTFPPPQPPHYPPPPIYSTQHPPPALPHHQAPPRYVTPPPQRYTTPPTQSTQYEDRSHLGSPQYPPAPWPAPQRATGPPPPLGSLPTVRPPFY